MSDQDTSVRPWELPSFEPPAPAQPEADLAQQEARARARGFEQGSAQGRQEGLAEAQQILGRAGLLLEGMAKPYQHLDQLVTRELVQTAMMIARQIIRRELTLDSNLVMDAVSEALATLSNLEGEMEIHLNPADISMVRGLAPEVLEGKSWKLMEDPEMLPGGCRLKTPVSYVDASVERQMEMMLTRLLDACEEPLGN